MIPEVARELGWKVSRLESFNSDWDVWWTDQGVESDRLMIMKPYQKINHFPNMYLIARKNFLSNSLHKLAKIFPDDYNFFPQTWNLPQDFANLKAYYTAHSSPAKKLGNKTLTKSNRMQMIVKPESLSQGKGIFITNVIDEVDP